MSARRKHPCETLISRVAGLPPEASAWETVAVDALRAAPSLLAADGALGVPRGTTQRWRRWLVAHGHELPEPRPGWRPGAPLPPPPTAEQARAAAAASATAKAAKAAARAEHRARWLKSRGYT
jgi:hypothetical protein